MRYPPFGHVTEAQWDAFGRGYGVLPERKRMLLYLVMQRLCAALGAYVAPAYERRNGWADGCLADLEWALDEIEGS